MKKKENILLIKHGALGDLIQADGIFKTIKSHHKNTNIFLLTSNKFFNLMANCPYIDHILIDDRPSFLNIVYYINLYKKIAHQNFKIIW